MDKNVAVWIRFRVDPKHALHGFDSRIEYPSPIRFDDIRPRKYELFAFFRFSNLNASGT